jgi:hypothetical protein
MQNDAPVVAIEHRRQRQPTAPWPIPVRFYDLRIPDLDIGTERTLASIRRADLFGGGLEKAASRLVATPGLAKQNGASEHELLEAITHMAFYAGRQEAMSANTSAKEVSLPTSAAENSSDVFPDPPGLWPELPTG